MDYADNILFDLFIEDFDELVEGKEDDALELWMEKQEELYDRRIDNRSKYLAKLYEAANLVEEMLKKPEIINENMNIIKTFVNANKMNIPSRYYPLKCKQT